MDDFKYLFPSEWKKARDAERERQANERVWYIALFLIGGGGLLYFWLHFHSYVMYMASN